MMKQKLLNTSMAIVMGVSVINLPNPALASQNLGSGTLTHELHLFPECVAVGPSGPYCQPSYGNDLNLSKATVWLDLLLNAATALDLASSLFQGDRTIDAKDAIKKLEEALKGKGGQGQGGSSGGDTSGSASLATVYTDDHILSVIELSENKNPQTLFDSVRTAVKEYVFETSASDIKGDCGQSDKDCAIERQKEWLLASVTLASATADRVLDQTAKKNVQDVQTDAEKSEDDQEKGGNATTGGGGTPLTGHFASLASNFNAAQSPMDLYNAMANIVLDTHRQINDANALMGRDLEAQGLRIINETGPVLLTEEAEEE